ncbi:hypothetical protein MKK75_14815 [Methylobacterium sp. J-030]|uniref:Rap1a/Tai family immunity protein n=1 Tax=Methylobacterium sp. J-030 TaxID=2836627 RepID=UPI001FBB15C4|nr:Rap1a/Tai family immunity protein [Methylobacterium sp. J-030]MCJ2070051.1 hypothetical protein [Methylobacterium sp. J-030]
MISLPSLRAIKLRVVALAVASVVVGPVSPARAEAPIVVSTVTTSMLLAECRGSRSELSADFCLGYIIAYFDLMSIRREICPKSGAATQQASAIGRRFVEAHPELWDRHPSYLLELAFKAAFPCPAE